VVSDGRLLRSPTERVHSLISLDVRFVQSLLSLSPESSVFGVVARITKWSVVLWVGTIGEPLLCSPRLDPSSGIEVVVGPGIRRLITVGAGVLRCASSCPLQVPMYGPIGHAPLDRANGKDEIIHVP
jgi:hypothetical protein